MTANDRIWMSVEVQVGDKVSLFEEDQIRALLDLVAAPRPGQSFTVRVDPEEYSAKVIYIAFPEAPAHEIPLFEIARSWAVLREKGTVDGLTPHGLTTAQAVQVIDHACSHLPKHSTSRSAK